MNEIQHNINYEKKLVELLGYNLIGPDNSNRWLIRDDNGNQVGFIQYKKIYSENKKRGLPALFGYYTTIDSPIINYNFCRKCNNSNYRNDIDNFHYELDIKNKNEGNDSIELDIGEYPTLRMWSQKYGFIDFHVADGGFHLNFKSKTENFNIEEYVYFKNETEASHSAQYIYQIRYCDKNLKLDDDNLKGTIIREISGKYNQYYQEDNRLELSEKSWINGKLRTNRKNVVIGNIKEMAIKHQMGIDAFNHFRFLINEILPFKEDIISTLLSDVDIKQTGLSIFLNDYEDQNTNAKTLKK